MKNKLSDLNNHLFAQMERLSDEEMTPEDLEKEINRSKAINSVAREILQVGRLELSARKAYANNEIGEPTGMLQLEDKASK